MKVVIVSLLGSFLLLQANARAESALRLCQELGDSLPAKIAAKCASLIQEEEERIAREAEIERRKEVELAALTVAVKEQATRSAHLQKSWREAGLKGTLNTDRLSCERNETYVSEPAVFICKQPLGKGKHPTNCTYDGGCRDFDIRTKYFFFVVNPDGTIDDKKYPQTSTYFDHCGIRQCAG